MGQAWAQKVSNELDRVNAIAIASIDDQILPRAVGNED